MNLADIIRGKRGPEKREALICSAVQFTAGLLLSVAALLTPKLEGLAIIGLVYITGALVPIYTNRDWLNRK